MELIRVSKTKLKYLLRTYVLGTFLQNEYILVLLPNLHSSGRLQMEVQ